LKDKSLFTFENAMDILI